MFLDSMFLSWISDCSHLSCWGESNDIEIDLFGDSRKKELIRKCQTKRLLLILHVRKRKSHFFLEDLSYFPMW